MAEDQSALIQNIYDLTMVTNHADSLVSRMEGNIGRRSTSLPKHTTHEASAIAVRLHTIATRLSRAVHDHERHTISELLSDAIHDQQRSTREAAEQG